MWKPFRTEAILAKSNNLETKMSNILLEYSLKYNIDMRSAGVVGHMSKLLENSIRTKSKAVFLQPVRSVYALYPTSMKVYVRKSLLIYLDIKWIAILTLTT